MDRRQFLAASAGLAVAGRDVDVAVSAREQQAPVTAAAAPLAPVFKTKPHKALIQQKPTEAFLNEIKAAGFEGLESYTVPVAEAEAIRAVATKLGMRIHSVLRGNAFFNSPDASVVQKGFADAEESIRCAQAYGADAVLLVPCRIEAFTPGGFGRKDGIAMPRPWEFQLEWDQRTGHVTRVVYADNPRYADYMAAQNRAVDAGTEWVKKLIPIAEKAGVVIAIENVWNNLWVDPKYFRSFVQSFQSKWVRAYYDIGNHIKFGWPEQWILALGDLIVKIHVKDYLLDPADPDGQGKFVNIRDGSVRWPVVRNALDQIGYNGWMTIEAPINLSVADQSQRLDLILEGR